MYTIENRSLGMPGRTAPSICESYRKELEFVIAQVWMTGGQQSQMLNDSIVIDAHLKEDLGVIWRVDNIINGACLAAALRRYSGTEIQLVGSLRLAHCTRRHLLGGRRQISRRPCNSKEKYRLHPC
jgi:hypothetical protein